MQGRKAYGCMLTKTLRTRWLFETRVGGFASHWMSGSFISVMATEFECMGIRILSQEDLDERWPVC